LAEVNQVITGDSTVVQGCCLAKYGKTKTAL